jgi:hypothetical protein
MPNVNGIKRTEKESDFHERIDFIQKFEPKLGLLF